jgi:hypothetical protein
LKNKGVGGDLNQTVQNANCGGKVVQCNVSFWQSWNLEKTIVHGDMA